MPAAYFPSHAWSWARICDLGSTDGHTCTASEAEAGTGKSNQMAHGGSGGHTTQLQGVVTRAAGAASWTLKHQW